MLEGLRGLVNEVGKTVVEGNNLESSDRVIAIFLRAQLE